MRLLVGPSAVSGFSVLLFAGTVVESGVRINPHREAGVSAKMDNGHGSFGDSERHERPFPNAERSRSRRLVRNLRAGRAAKALARSGNPSSQGFRLLPYHRLKQESSLLESLPNRGVRVHNHTTIVPANRNISKKMMKVTAECRVEYQCMPRFACAESGSMGAWYPTACSLGRVLLN